MKKRYMIAICLVALGCNRTEPTSSGSAIVGAYNVTETNNNMFVTGGWGGQPVYRAQMTDEESRVVHGILRRMKPDKP